MGTPPGWRSEHNWTMLVVMKDDIWVKVNKSLLLDTMLSVSLAVYVERVVGSMVHVYER